MRAPRGGASLLYPAPHIKHSYLVVTLPTIAKLHQKSTNYIHKLYSFSRNCKRGHICEQVTLSVWQPCWERFSLHIKQITSSWLQRQDWSSRKSRAHKMRDWNMQHKKSAWKDFGNPKLCLCELHCFCGTHGYKHINHDNLILAWDPDTRRIKRKRRTRYCALLESTSTYILHKLLVEKFENSLLKTSQRALWKRCSSTSRGNCHAVTQAAVAACKGPAKHISFTWKMEGSSSVQPWVKAKMKNVIDLL